MPLLLLQAPAPGHRTEQRRRKNWVSITASIHQRGFHDWINFWRYASEYTSVIHALALTTMPWTTPFRNLSACSYLSVKASWENMGREMVINWLLMITKLGRQTGSSAVKWPWAGSRGGETPDSRWWWGDVWMGRWRQGVVPVAVVWEPWAELSSVSRVPRRGYISPPGVTRRSSIPTHTQWTTPPTTTKPQEAHHLLRRNKINYANLCFS